MTENSLKNLKSAVFYIGISAIICYALGLTLNRDRSFELISKEQLNQVTDMMKVYPEGIRAIVKNYHRTEYWQDVATVFRMREQKEPSIIGGIVLQFIGDDNG